MQEIVPMTPPTHSHQYILNLKWTKCCQWKSSGHLECDLGRLELTVVTGQFSISYWQESK